VSTSWWQARKAELEVSLWILGMCVLAQAAIVVLTDGTRILPIAGTCISGVWFLYEVVQYDLHMRKKVNQ
jgi:hypothetical protein